MVENKVDKRGNGMPPDQLSAGRGFSSLWLHMSVGLIDLTQVNWLINEFTPRSFLRLDNLCQPVCHSLFLSSFDYFGGEC